MTAPVDPVGVPCLFNSALDPGWAPNTGVCPDWATANYSPAIQTFAINFATLLMYTATGRQFGLCDTTLRPCWNQTLPTYLTYPSLWNAGQYGGQYAWGLVAFVNGDILYGGGCGCAPGSSCGCMPPEVALPMPVYRIISVTIDGATLAPSAYRADGNMLVRQDGQAWPSNQNLGAPLGGVNTWSVRYAKGQPVPVALNDAAGILANELAKARVGGACRLPQRIQSVTRQGVTVQALPLQELLDKGLTGIVEVDMAILAVNPFGLKQRPRVTSPDLPQWRPV
jgi:hypothetical protein